MNIIKGDVCQVPEVLRKNLQLSPTCHIHVVVVCSSDVDFNRKQKAYLQKLQPKERLPIKTEHKFWEQAIGLMFLNDVWISRELTFHIMVQGE